MYDNGYLPPILTVDSVIFQLINGVLSVLLIRRRTEPFKDSWALPGGFCAAGETTVGAMSRILRAKAGLDAAQLGLVEQLYTFDTVARDPRGHAVSVTYMGIGLDIGLQAGPETQEPRFFAVDDLPAIAYDHADIISYGRERLRSKLEYTNASFALLPQQVTLPEIQAAYEAVIGHPLDKRNFRKKFQSLGIIEPLPQLRRDGAHRPAQLYTYVSSRLAPLRRTFE